MVRILLFLGIFTIPFSFDYSMFIIPISGHSGWTNGFVVTLSDLFFLFLFIVWKIYHFNQLSVRNKSFFLFPIGLLFIAYLISLTGAVWRQFSIFEILQYCKITFLYYYVPLTVLQNKEDLKFVCNSLLAVLLFQSVLAIAQFFFQDFYNFMRTGSPVSLTIFGDYIRSQGTIGQPNAFAAFIIPILFLDQIILLSTKGKIKIIYFFILIAGTIALIFTFSRAGWFTFLFGTSLLVFLKRKGDINPAKCIFALAIIALIILFCHNFLNARLTTDDNGSTQDRWYLMQIAFEMIKDNFYTGVGVNNYWFAMNHYIPKGYDWPFIYLVHNVFLLVFAESGILGFSAIILIFVEPIIRAFRLYQTSGLPVRGYALWLATSFLAVGVMNMVDLTWAAPILNSFYFLLLGVAAIALNLAYITKPQVRNKMFSGQGRGNLYPGKKIVELSKGGNMPVFAAKEENQFRLKYSRF